MGTGKSSVGKRLAKEMNSPFIDTDRVIEERTGRQIADVFAHEGEQFFRMKESEILAESLRALEPTVIATGGGIVTSGDNRHALREARASGVAIVVWLDAEPEELHERIGHGTNRPLLAHNALGVLTRLSHERRHFYESVSSFVVDTGNKGVVDVVEDIIGHVSPNSPKEVN